MTQAIRIQAAQIDARFQELRDKGFKVFESGARRSAVEERYDLIPTAGLKAMALTFASGAKKYGEHTWEKGIPLSDLTNRVLRHMVMYQSGDRSEDHLAHAACNLMMMLHFRENRQA